jgi:hypothetical protein
VPLNRASTATLPAGGQRVPRSPGPPGCASASEHHRCPRRERASPISFSIVVGLIGAGGLLSESGCGSRTRASGRPCIRAPCAANAFERLFLPCSAGAERKAVAVGMHSRRISRGVSIGEAGLTDHTQISHARRCCCCCSCGLSGRLVASGCATLSQSGAHLFPSRRRNGVLAPEWTSYRQVPSREQSNTLSASWLAFCHFSASPSSWCILFHHQLRTHKNERDPPPNRC